MFRCGYILPICFRFWVYHLVGHLFLRSGGVQGPQVGIRVEFYASGGASFACASTQILSTTKVGRAYITFFGIFVYIRVRGVCHRDEWWTVGAIDCAREQQPAVRAVALFGASYFLSTSTRYEYSNLFQQKIYWKILVGGKLSTGSLR